MVVNRRVTPLTQVRFPGAARNFSPSQLSEQTLLHVSVHPLCAIACIHVCAHVKDPVVYVRVRWIMETLKHPACTVSSATLSQLAFPGEKAIRISHGRKLIETIQL